MELIPKAETSLFLPWSSPLTSYNNDSTQDNFNLYLVTSFITLKKLARNGLLLSFFWLLILFLIRVQGLEFYALEFFLKQEKCRCTTLVRLELSVLLGSLRFFICFKMTFEKNEIFKRNNNCISLENCKRKVLKLFTCSNWHARANKQKLKQNTELIPPSSKENSLLGETKSSLNAYPVLQSNTYVFFNQIIIFFFEFKVFFF